MYKIKEIHHISWLKSVCLFILTDRSGSSWSQEAEWTSGSSSATCPRRCSRWEKLSLTLGVTESQDIVELATEVAQVYFDDRLPVHSLVLPNGNLEDTMNFIKWNMEERLVSFVVIREMNLLFRYGDTWGCYVIRDWRRYIYRAFI